MLKFLVSRNILTALGLFDSDPASGNAIMEYVLDVLKLIKFIGGSADRITFFLQFGSSQCLSVMFFRIGKRRTEKPATCLALMI